MDSYNGQLPLNYMQAVELFLIDLICNSLTQI